MIKKQLFLLFYLLLCLSFAYSEDNSKSPSLIENTTISGQWFVNNIYDDASRIDRFSLKRGYFTIKSKLNDMFSVRYTQDITIDNEGSDAGNVEMRLKYLYMKMQLKEIEMLKDSYFEIGLVHRPWLDYEEHINRYRVQGQMYIERYGIVNSADFGITFVSLIGGEINKDYQKNVSKSYPGKYGSIALGVYNGGGYHAVEFNNNKTFEGRLSLRPLPTVYPGFQLTYNYIIGMANTITNQSDFIVNILMLSSQNEHHTATVQYYNGIGDFRGHYATNLGRSLHNTGYSLFGELDIPSTSIALMGRYDNFSSEINKIFDQETTIAGIAYKFLKSKVLLDINRNIQHDITINTIELALEIIF